MYDPITRSVVEITRQQWRDRNTIRDSRGELGNFIIQDLTSRDFPAPWGGWVRVKLVFVGAYGVRFLIIASSETDSGAAEAEAISRTADDLPEADNTHEAYEQLATECNRVLGLFEMYGQRIAKERDAKVLENTRQLMQKAPVKPTGKRKRVKLR